ncbi:PQQ-dependent sugar dehydrogenase [Luteimonas sp. BDR2-5]|uniref:PQQ-dependent sugar dehydrogenase n=1 Tax=Proluteimonas luteida TaxID=2878685 RepID=UPI001E478B54|nr:PQQ-dependent sugar dehydrogenase [Luteimonas sp. BDR2-5]MCD9027137.1 PQQ-dependent sugar dehydrogenase [Luteimonas sp. BDR2-5]
MRRNVPTLTSLAASLLLLSACNGNASPSADADPATATQEETAPAADPADDAQAALPFASEAVASFDEPWALGFLPDGRLLVTEKPGTLQLVTLPGGAKQEIAGVPAVGYGGQGGFGDITPHPQFADNDLVYLSYAEDGDGGRGAAVARARLAFDADGAGTLQDLEVIWRQVPKVSGNGHYAHRIAFDEAGKLWIASGDRQKFDPAQDMQSNLGKILRLNDDGSVPDDNPFVDQGGVAAQVWSLGHRNPLGLAFDAQGRPWDVEMGPAGGDELNLVVRGENYGYPLVSNGNHYDGRPIPDHDTRPEFKAPAITWTPVISPSSLMFYSGTLFPEWTGNAFIGGLSGQTLVRVEIDGDNAREAERFPMGARIRDVAQGPDGALWVIEDGKDGRLLKLTPRG